MSARLLAAFCLFTTLVGGSRAESLGTPDSRLVVYLAAAADQPPAPIAQMKRELGSILRDAGYRVEWLTRGSDNTQTPDAPFLVVLQLKGVCALDADHDAAESVPQAVSLATTAVSDGRVLPFSAVNCAALRRTIAPSVAKQPGAVRDFLFSRAMARVIAHELYHVLAGTTEHAHAGIARSCYSTADLLGERFDFQPVDLARLHPRQETRGDASGEESSGR
jgi:hypothetical protein